MMILYINILIINLVKFRQKFALWEIQEKLSFKKIQKILY